MFLSLIITVIFISNLYHFSHAEEGHRSQGPMAVARQLKPNEITSTPEVPELPPPRMNGHDKVEENVVSIRRSSQRPMSMGGLSLSLQREEDCYTVMSPAGPLTMLPHSTGSLGPVSFFTCRGRAQIPRSYGCC